MLKEQDPDAGGARSRALYYACQSGDEKEQKRAYEELGSYLYRLAYKGLRDAELAHDCVQETLIQIHTHIDTIKEPGAFLGYTRTTLAHVCARRGKGEAAQSQIEEAIKREIGKALAQDDNRSSSTSSVSLLLDCLVEALARLDKDSQMVLVLKYFSTLNDPQIATLLNTNTRNIYTRRSRAKDKLLADPQLLDCLRERAGRVVSR